MLLDSSLTDAVQLLSPVSLEELGKISLMDRVDTKYVVNDSLLPGLFEELTDDYMVLEAFGVRCAPYYSDYFDSPTSRCYFDHHRGKGERYKFRIRKYLSSDVAFFEVKHRTSKGRTIKRRVQIDAHQMSIDAQSQSLISTVYGKHIDLSPQLQTTYTRITLADRAATERVTIDTLLHFRAGDQEAGVPGAAIIEVKQSQDSRLSTVRRCLRNRHIVPLRISKYCIGRALLDPTLKHNRFKAKLRALQKLSSQGEELCGDI